MRSSGDDRTSRESRSEASTTRSSSSNEVTLKEERNRQQYTQQKPIQVSFQKSLYIPSVNDFPCFQPKQSQEQLMKEKEDRIVKRHLFGVPPPDDPRIFDDAAASFEWYNYHRHSLLYP
jgi:hypothetical protein